MILKCYGLNLTVECRYNSLTIGTASSWIPHLCVFLLVDMQS